jgi:hypothetical protein
VANPTLIGDLMRRDPEMKTIITAKQRRRDEGRRECEARAVVLQRIIDTYRANGRNVPSHIIDEMTRVGGVAQ